MIFGLTLLFPLKFLSEGLPFLSSLLLSYRLSPTGLLSYILSFICLFSLLLPSIYLGIRLSSLPLSAGSLLSSLALSLLDLLSAVPCLSALPLYAGMRGGLASLPIGPTLLASILIGLLMFKLTARWSYGVCASILSDS